MLLAFNALVKVQLSLPITHCPGVFMWSHRRDCFKDVIKHVWVAGIVLCRVPAEGTCQKVWRLLCRYCGTWARGIVREFAASVVGLKRDWSEIWSALILTQFNLFLQKRLHFSIYLVNTFQRLCFGDHLTFANIPVQSSQEAAARRIYKYLLNQCNAAITTHICSPVEKDSR